MHSNDRAAFAFARAWIHAGVTYAAGDVAELTTADIEKLTRLGAGAPPERKTEPKGKKAPLPPQ